MVAFHRRTTLPSPVEAICLPSGEKSASAISAVVVIVSNINLPVATSQILTTPSTVATRSCVSSGEKWTLCAEVGTGMLTMRFPSATRQISALFMQPAVARRIPL